MVDDHEGGRYEQCFEDRYPFIETCGFAEASRYVKDHEPDEDHISRYQRCEFSLNAGDQRDTCGSQSNTSHIRPEDVAGNPARHESFHEVNKEKMLNAADQKEDT